MLAISRWSNRESWKAPVSTSLASAIGSAVPQSNTSMATGQP
jgi:hypothetical protein